MSDNSERLLAAFRLLAIGNALWVVPGLMPYDVPLPFWDILRSGVYSLFSLVALVFMVMAAVRARPDREGDAE